MSDLNIIIGAEAIGKALGVTRRTVYHLVEHDRLPTFHLGGKLAVRRERLTAWISETEAAADAERAARRAGEGGA